MWCFISTTSYLAFCFRFSMCFCFIIWRSGWNDYSIKPIRRLLCSRICTIFYYERGMVCLLVWDWCLCKRLDSGNVILFDMREIRKIPCTCTLLKRYNVWRWRCKVSKYNIIIVLVFLDFQVLYLIGALFRHFCIEVMELCCVWLMLIYVF